MWNFDLNFYIVDWGMIFEALLCLHLCSPDCGLPQKTCGHWLCDSLCYISWETLSYLPFRFFRYFGESKLCFTKTWCLIIVMHKSWETIPFLRKLLAEMREPWAVKEKLSDSISKLRETNLTFAIPENRRQKELVSKSLIHCQMQKSLGNRVICRSRNFTMKTQVPEHLWASPRNHKK